MAANFASFWQPFLETADFVVLDGGLATELERRGADLRDPLWSAKVLLENPELISQVHRDYLLAGADVITSASYQASFAGLARRGLDHAHATELLTSSVRLAREVRDQFWKTPPSGRARPLVAASVGCFGAFLHDGSEYRGDYGLSVNQLEDWHRPRIEVLARSGADLLACETIPCLAEAEALANLLAELPDTPAWMAFSCRDENHVCHGETLAECVATACEAPNVVAVGVNCTAPEFVEPLLRTLNGVTDRPLLAYPNSGEMWHAAGQRWRSGRAPCSDWTQAVRRWHAAGARLIGGCCRTTPATIMEIARARAPGATMKPRRILFVCVENSCRSQMAEAFARRHAGPEVEIYSSGSRPSGKVNPSAIDFMKEVGYDLAEHRSKGLHEVPQDGYDVAVTMGCGDKCPSVHARAHVDWGIPDPKNLPAEKFREVRDLIETRVKALLGI